MGSLESGLSLKRDSSYLLRSTSKNNNERQSQSPFGQRQQPRSRFARFLLFKKIDYYLLWICTVAVFLFFVVVFQMFLPGFVMDTSDNFVKDREVGESKDLMVLKEIGGLDFGEDVKFESSKLLHKFEKEGTEGNTNMSVGSRRVLRFGCRKPQLALVFADLLVDPQQILMVTVAAALRVIGYEIEVYSLEDGPVHAVWRNMGVPVNIVDLSEKTKIAIDWLNYDGVLVNFIEARSVISSLLQEPFKSVPLIWTIHETTLATRIRKYMSSSQVELIDDWKVHFNRASVVVFPNHALPMFYAACDAGNYFVIPGSPVEACETNNFGVIDKNNEREKMQFGPEDFVIAIVGSQLLYRGLWLEQALILQAILPLLADLPFDEKSNSNLKIVILSGDVTGNYSVAMEKIALNLRYPNGTVKHARIDEDADGVLSMADLVIYGSFLEEQTFPDILVKAMCFGKPIVAPDLSMIRKYIDDRVNGYLFPKENIGVLTQIILQVASKRQLSPLARNVASIGKHSAKTLMVSESIEGYASLIENVLKLPSEVASPRSVSEIPADLKMQWRWHLFDGITDQAHVNRTSKSFSFLDKLENDRNHTRRESSDTVIAIDETFVYNLWEEQKNIDMTKTRKRREDDELKDRTEQPRGTWEEVYRSVKKADRLKNELHERDDGELERTGQSLTIYEPYFGQGAWPFLHRNSLYRGIGLSTKGRRPGIDDVDAPSRLPLLSTPYYRDALGEFGALFAIANRIDRLHRNAWIGFLSWRATARKASLSKTAEITLLDDIQARRHGDALYFWVRMDKDPRNPLQQNDLWSFCDAVNAGNCKFAFSEALKKMYGMNHDWNSLPPMPVDGDTWSVMHSWVLPTKSFLEFAMFSRMFVDALDAEIYEEHHQNGRCYLSLSKDKHCYSRLLELLINVWAYHSSRRMVYIDPITGAIQEQHKFKSRRGQMWVKWFNYTTLKSMDEDLAEESDSDHPRRRWLWPSTGEVFWQGMYEKEKNQLRKDKAKRKQKSKEKIQRIRDRTHQKALGKYVKPPPEEVEVKVDSSNTTVTAKRLFR